MDININMDLLKELLKLKDKDLNEEDISESHLDDLVIKATDAFWDVITKEYPQLKVEKLPNDALIKFEEFDKEAAKMISMLIDASKRAD